MTVVDDALITLQKLATYHRQQLNLPVVALTGSNGKTTTKELIVSILSQEFDVVGTKGNLNNHIGVPLTLLSFTESTQIGIVEMGANHIGEIAALCEIAQPNTGLITNFGKAHLEGFGSLEGVKIGKSEMYSYLKKTGGKAILRSQDVDQIERAKNMNSTLAPIFNIIESQPLNLKWEQETFETQLTGLYNVGNMELAAAVGLEMSLSIDQIIRGIVTYEPQNNRSQIIQRQALTIIMDAYNANPSSMRVALENLSGQTGSKTAILGDMFELGAYAQEEHQQIVDLVSALNIDTVFYIGANFFDLKVPEDSRFKTFEDFKNFFKKESISESNTLLIKGSRGMALERVLDLL